MPRFKSFQHPERTALFRLFETFPAERAKFEQYLHTVLDDQVGRRLLKHPIFSGMPSQCLKRVTLLLERKVSHPQSLIFEEGEVGSSMVVFNVGKADILFRGTQVSMLWAGKSFGAAQMMGVVQHYHATVRTKTMCGWDDLLFFQWFSTEVKTEFVVLFHLQDPRLSISSRLLQQVKQCKTPCVKLCQNVQHTGLLYSAIASDIVSSWMPELWLCWFRFRWQNLIWPRYRLTMVRQWEGIRHSEVSWIDHLNRLWIYDVLFLSWPRAQVTFWCWHSNASVHWPRPDRNDHGLIPWSKERGWHISRQMVRG